MASGADTAATNGGNPAGPARVLLSNEFKEEK